MKFDVVVGNPPYQEETKDTSDKPVYNNFYDLAKEVSTRYCLVTPARFLFNAGSTDKKWNEKMLSDDKLRVAFYEQDSAKVFPNTDIQGGVAILYRDERRVLGPIGDFTKYPLLNDIVKKVSSFGEDSIVGEIHLQQKFNLLELYKTHPQVKIKVGSNGKEKRLTTSIFSTLNIFTDSATSDSDVAILGLIKNKRIVKYVDSKFLEPHQNTYLWKVLIPKSNGSSGLGVIGEPLVGEPNSGHTQSFISIGRFDSEEHAKNLLKYIKTKFARALLGALKVTQDNNPATWAKVPNLDFSEESNVNWGESIDCIDEQLFNMYGFSDEERAFIREKVRPME